MISARRLVIDGLILSAAFTFLVVGSLLADPTVWLGDYPPDVQAAVANAIEAPRALRFSVGGMLFVVIIGGLVLSLRRLDSDAGGIGFWRAAIHTFLMFWIVNATDVVIVDWLFFMTLLRPRIVLPGTEGLAGYDDYFFHFEASFLTLDPWVAALILSLGVAAAWRLLRLFSGRSSVNEPSKAT